MQEIHGNMTVNYVKMRGLQPDAWYEESASKKRYTGIALMEAGLPLPVETGEYQAYQMHFTIVE